MLSSWLENGSVKSGMLSNVSHVELEAFRFT